MSRLFNEFIERTFAGNNHAKEQELSNQLNAEHQEWHHERKKWISGEITLLNGGTIEQWESLGKPKNNNEKL